MTVLPTALGRNHIGVRRSADNTQSWAGAVPSSPFSGCFNMDGEGVSVKLSGCRPITHRDGQVAHPPLLLVGASIWMERGCQ